MRPDKKRKTEYLLSELGEIDDKLLIDALSYRPARKRPQLAVIAACFILCLTFIFAAAVGLRTANKKNADGADTGTRSPEVNIGDNESYENPEADRKLDMIFLSCISDTRYQGHESVDELPCEKGKTYVVWQHVESGRIFLSSPLTDSQVKALDKHLGEGDSVGESSPDLECRVWILTSEGLLISPYLRETVGNVSDSFFDYEAEIIPCEEFVDLISRILE